MKKMPALLSISAILICSFVLGSLIYERFAEDKAKQAEEIQLHMKQTKEILEQQSTMIETLKQIASSGTLRVAGNSTPDSISSLYRMKKGLHNGKPCYETADEKWCIWYDAEDGYWIISSAPGSIAHAWAKEAGGESPAGRYVPWNNATGTATVDWDCSTAKLEGEDGKHLVPDYGQLLDSQVLR